MISKISVFSFIFLAISTVLAFPKGHDVHELCCDVWDGENCDLSCPEGMAITAVDFASYGTPG